MVIQEHVRHDPEDETRRLRRGLHGDQEGKISNCVLNVLVKWGWVGIHREFFREKAAQ